MFPCYLQHLVNKILPFLFYQGGGDCDFRFDRTINADVEDSQVHIAAQTLEQIPILSNLQRSAVDFLHELHHNQMIY